MKLPSYIFINLTQRKQLLKFFLLFFSLIIVPVVISSQISYTYSNNVIENEIKNSNKYVMDNMISYIDENLLKIKQRIIALGNDSDLNSIIFDERNWVSPTYSYVKLKEKLHALESNESVFEDVFIYFVKQKTLLSREGQYDFNFYFNSIYKFEGLDSEFWGNYLETEATASDFDVLSNRKVSGYRWDDNSSKNLISFKLTYPFYFSPRAALVFFISENYFIDIISKYGSANNTNYIIINKDGDPIAAYGSSPIFTNNDIKDNIDRINSEKQGILRIHTKDSALSVTYSTSPITGWIYMTAVPLSQISNQSKFIKTIRVYIITIFIFIGLFVSIWLSRKQYKPIATLVEYLDKLNGASVADKNEKQLNEFTFIKNQFNIIYHANENLKRALNAELPFLVQNLFYRIMKGNILAENEVTSELKKYNIELTKDSFIVVLIKLDFLSRPDEDKKLDVMLVDVRNKIISIIFAMLSNKFVCYAIEMDFHNIAYIMNYDYEMHVEIETVCNTIKEFFNSDQYHLRLTIGIGQRCSKLTDIKEAYDKANKAINMRAFSEESQVITYSKNMLNYPYELHSYTYEIKSVTNYLLAGEYKKGTETALEILDKCIEKKLPYCIVNDIVNSLINTALSILEIKGRKNDEQIINVEEIDNKLNKLVSLNEYENLIIDVYAIVEGILKNKVSIKKEEISTYITKFVDDNYYKDIYLETVASELNMSTNYLSHFFKNIIGVSFSDYLGRVRVEKAKELLSKTDLSLNEIAGSVGYTNVNSLIRTFKKLEAITPGRFRELNKQ